MKIFQKAVMLIVLSGLLMGTTINNTDPEIASFEYERVLALANEYLSETPLTVTSYTCVRSEGGTHDFYSEGDYWWPDPEHAEGPYLRRDGQSNPENFNAHRVAMRNMSVWVPGLVAAYKLTGDEKYARHALEHLNAWFVNPETRMNPNLLYAQAIKGRVSGRGIGIIDTIHLIEVAKAIAEFKSSGFIKVGDLEAILSWFREYTVWLTTHPYGIDERDHGNNHSAWWLAQVAAFSTLTGDKENLEFCRSFYKETILPNQLDTLGRFTDELSRTKPYSYSLFNLEAFALICHILSTSEDDLWNYSTASGKSTKLAMKFMAPYMQDKSSWPYPPDIEHFEELPVRGSALLFAGIAYGNQEYIDLWKSLSPDLPSQELVRTFVLRQPILWIEE